MKKNKMQKNNSNAKAMNCNKTNAKAKTNSKVSNKSDDKNIGFDDDNSNSFELK